MGGTSDQLGCIGMHKAVGLTVVESTDGPVILHSHQAITYDQARRSKEKDMLLFFAQTQDYDIIIDSNAQKYGGLQFMVTDQDDESHIVTFAFEKGITIMFHRKTRNEEIDNLPILNIPHSQWKWKPKRQPQK